MAELTISAFIGKVVSVLDLDVEPETVGRYDSLFDELGLDSLQTFQLLITIEALADLAVPPMDLPEIYTVDDAFQYYLSARKMAMQESGE